jgi:EmrB/QacA subfamily drug resistance transporter
VGAGRAGGRPADADPAADLAPAPSRRLTWSACLGAFVVTLTLSVTNVAIPDLRDEFPDASTATLSWVLNSYAIVFGALLVPAGRWGDRHGLRTVFLLGLTTFAAGSLLVAVAPVLPLVIAARAVQAASGALVMPTSLGLVLVATPPDQRAAAVGRWGSVTALGVAAGPSLGALVVDRAGWRAAFVGVAAVAVVAWAVGRRALARGRVDAGAIPVDGVGLLALVGATAAGSLAIVQGPSWGWGAPRTLAAGVVAVVFGAVFVVRSLHHPEPVLPLDLFRYRTFSVANVAAMLFSASTGAILLTYVLFLTDVWGWSVQRAGLAMVPSPVLAATTAPMIGRLAQRHGPRPFAVAGCVVVACATGWLAWRVGPEPDFLREWLPGTASVGLGIALTFPTLASASVTEIPVERLGVATGTNQAVRQLGAVVGVAVVVAVLGDETSGPDALDAFHRAWFTLFGLSLAGGFAALLLRPARSPTVGAGDRDSALGAAGRPG